MYLLAPLCAWGRQRGKVSQTDSRGFCPIVSMAAAPPPPHLQIIIITILRSMGAKEPFARRSIDRQRVWEDGQPVVIAVGVHLQLLQLLVDLPQISHGWSRTWVCATHVDLSPAQFRAEGQDGFQPLALLGQTHTHTHTHTHISTTCTNIEDILC